MLLQIFVEADMDVCLGRRSMSTTIYIFLPSVANAAMQFYEMLKNVDEILKASSSNGSLLSSHHTLNMLSRNDIYQVGPLPFPFNKIM